MKKISRIRFDALAGYARQPGTHLIFEEGEWFEHENERLLGTAVRDTTDGDFGAIVMGRDKLGRYRCIDFTKFYGTPDEAIAALQLLFNKQEALSDSEYFQDDEKGRPLDFFAPAVKPERYHQSFATIAKADKWSPARGIIKAMMHYYEDPDGNFIEQFQTTGFDARIWELYLFAALTEQGYIFDRSCAAPDFLCNGLAGSFFAEAVTVNPTVINGKSIETGLPSQEQQRKDYLDNYIPIKYGSALFSKLSKEYWKLPHIGNRPILLAVQDFHFPRSMTWSEVHLSAYLYGVRHKAHHDDAGKLHIDATPIQEHRWGNKIIPSGFFNQPHAQHISAVLTNSQATLNKFNRLGYLANFGDPKIDILRLGSCTNLDPSASEPINFIFDVRTKEYNETWSEGMNIYHNPSALVPLLVDMLPLAAHHFYEHGQIRSLIPQFHPINSLTIYGLSFTKIAEQLGDICREGEL
jgi:hypothetical protein